MGAVSLSSDSTPCSSKYGYFWFYKSNMALNKMPNVASRWLDTWIWIDIEFLICIHGFQMIYLQSERDFNEAGSLDLEVFLWCLCPARLTGTELKSDALFCSRTLRWRTLPVGGHTSEACDLQLQGKTSTTLFNLINTNSKLNIFTASLIPCFLSCRIFNLGVSRPSLENRGALSFLCRFSCIVSRLWGGGAQLGRLPSCCRASDPCWNLSPH